MESRGVVVIRDLDDLENYALQRAEAAPAIAERVRLVRPGLETEQVHTLQQELPGIPPRYLECVKRYALERVELGFVSLHPRGPARADLVSLLQAANGPANPLGTAYGELFLYEVGAVEGDAVCVAREDGHEYPDRVYWVERSSFPSLVVSPLCRDFTTFMLAAGRLWQAVGDDVDVGELLAGLTDDAQELESWSSLMSMLA
jgi:hypothetical protein